MFPLGNCLVSLEIDEGSFGGYFGDGGETTDSCSQEQISQDVLKLASNHHHHHHHHLRCIVLFLSTLGCFLGAKNIHSASPTHRKEGNFHLLSPYCVPECGSGPSVASKRRTVKRGFLQQPCDTWQRTASSSLCTVYFLIGRWLITSKGKVIT